MFIADFHIHSSYSRATSKECVPEGLDYWARVKGLDLIGTGDFTHPAWRGELKDKLEEAEEGLYVLKDEFRVRGNISEGAAPRYVVTGEISSIYKKNGRTRKVHNLIILPGLREAEALAVRLEAVGNLHSDGRPILGLDSRDLLEITLDVCPTAIFIPAHIWTPHFSLFGAYSGFDDIEECYEDLTPYIHALETGLSSDPPMNWRLSALDGYTLVSNSDAHSPANLAREANLFNTALSYPDIAHALGHPESGEFHGTIEFFPEEGKYHYDGHRNCKVCMKPGETIAANGVCPVCGGRITVGVLHRADALADRPEGYVPANAKHFESLVPLRELIASVVGVGPASKKVRARYDEMTRELGSELFILREAALSDIAVCQGPLMAEGVRRVRSGELDVQSGYDGEYGKVKVFTPDELERLAGQLNFFEGMDGIDFSVKGEEKTAPSTAAPGDDAAETDSRTHEDNNPYGLNNEQWEAVRAEDAAIAVIAGPGTGKTKTLVSRIARLVDTGVDPGSITAVTFTNKAAAQMRERLNVHFGDKRTAKAMNIGTFHAICLAYLSKNKEKTNVIDAQDALELAGQAVKATGRSISVREALRRILLVKSGAAGLADAGIPREVFDAYNAALAEYGALDFDDILLRALELFECGGVAGDDFKHLLIDEFQDINAVQYRLIRAWSKTSESVFAIGDPDQSIYGFRGSDLRCFDRFFDDYPGARRVGLVKNYRSTPQIIKCALSVFAGDRPLSAQRKDGESIRLLHADSAYAEAIYVAKEISRMVGGVDMLGAHARHKGADTKRTWHLTDIAVLYRTNRQAQALEQCLIQEGVPYVVAGRGDFLADPQVRDAIAFFRLLVNGGDNVARSACLDELGLLDKYSALKKERPQALIEMWMDDHGMSRSAPMELLLAAASAHGKMTDFIRTLILGREADVLRGSGKTYDPDAVSLMTLHAAKGLEFPVVFLCGLSDGIVPLANKDGSCDMGEEKRLLYVGMTRAEDELILLHPGEPSPFLAALPEGLIERGEANPRRYPDDMQISLFD